MPRVTCTHSLTVEEWRNEKGEANEERHPAFPLRFRRCLLCGVAYDRGSILSRLVEAIRARSRVGAIPTDHWDSNLEEW